MDAQPKTTEKERLFEELVKRLQLKDFNKPMVNYDHLKIEFKINGHNVKLEMK